MCLHRLCPSAAHACGVTTRSIRIDALTAGGMAAFYAIVVGWASGIDHLAAQARTDWYYLAAIVAGFGTQVALLAELRARRTAHRLEQVAGGTGAAASTVGMIACCAHHLADLTIIIGISGAATFLTDRRIEFMLGGIAVNLVGVAIAARRLLHTRPLASKGAPAWYAA